MSCYSHITHAMTCTAWKHCLMGACFCCQQQRISSYLLILSLLLLLFFFFRFWMLIMWKWRVHRHIMQTFVAVTINLLSSYFPFKHFFFLLFQFFFFVWKYSTIFVVKIKFNWIGDMWNICIHFSFLRFVIRMHFLTFSTKYHVNYAHRYSYDYVSTHSMKTKMMLRLFSWCCFCFLFFFL